jgi:hypothetical protein
MTNVIEATGRLTRILGGEILVAAKKDLCRKLFKR